MRGTDLVKRFFVLTFQSPSETGGGNLGGTGSPWKTHWEDLVRPIVSAETICGFGDP